MASEAPLARSFGAAAARRVARRAMSPASWQASAAACASARQTARSNSSLPGAIRPRPFGPRKASVSNLPDQQRNRPRPAELAGEDQVGEPKGEQFGVRPAGEDLSENLRRRERGRRVGHRRNPHEQRGKFTAPGRPEQLGDDAKTLLVDVGPSLSEPPPGTQDAAGRARIAARRTQMPGVAEGRLILAATEAAAGCGGGFQGEALTPGAGPGRRGARQIVQGIQSGAGEKCGFRGRLDRPARHRPTGHNWRGRGKSERFRELNHARKDSRRVRFAPSRCSKSAPPVGG